MSNDPKLSAIHQIAITVSDVDIALRFYRDVLGIPFLFSAGPELAFLDAGGVRLMLGTPQGAGSIGHNSILYSGFRTLSPCMPPLSPAALRMSERPRLLQG